MNTYISDADVFITTIDKEVYQFTVKGHIYVGSRNTIKDVAKKYNKQKLLEDFFEMVDNYDDSCSHEWLEYVGLTHRDIFCAICGEKREWEDDLW